jgi:glucose dehydrogenase
MQRAEKMIPSGSSMRIGLTCIAMFLLTGFCFGQAASSPSPSGSRPTTHVLTDWNQFHRRNMTRFNPYEKFLTVNNVGRLGLKWRSAAGFAVVTSPAVASGVVYVTSGDGNVYALNAHTGAMLWS